MNSRERVLAALDHREPDRIPLDLGAGVCCKMHADFYRRLLEYFGLSEEVIIYTKSARTVYPSDEVLRRLECDIRGPWPLYKSAPAAGGGDWEDDGYFYYRDGWGTVRRMPKSTPLYYDICECPLADASDEEMAAYELPGVSVLDEAGFERARGLREAGYPIVFSESYANGFLQTGPRVYGFENWLAMLALEDAEAVRFMDRLLEHKMRHYDNLFALYGDTLDIVCESDDLGTQTGPFISPDMFRDRFKPYWKRLFAHIKSRGNARIAMHCCGACEPLLGDLVDAGLEILNPVQISAAGMDPYHLKKEYGRDLAFWGGGVDTQKILPMGTPDEVRDNVKRNIDALAKDGGFIFATIHNVQSDVPVENFIAMWETFMDERNY